MMQRLCVTKAELIVYNSRMVDPNMPWSLKGISDEAREYAKRAAESSDVPVGAWLSSVIQAAAGPGGETRPVSNFADDPSQVEPSETSGSTIERAVQIVSDFGFEPEGPAHDTDLLDDADQLQALLEELEQRIDHSETLADDAIEPLSDEIARIKARLELLRGN